MTDLEKAIKAIPQQPQHQGAVQDQLAALYAAANRLGLYDAADLVKKDYGIEIRRLSKSTSNIRTT